MTAPVYEWQPTSRAIAQRLGIEPRDVMRFDHNTSPATDSGFARRIAADFTAFNEYPYADYRELRQLAAEYCDVEPEGVVPGAGADEMIALSAAAFLPHGGLAVTASPTYGLYAVATNRQEATLWEVPRLQPTFALDTAAMTEAAGKADLVWLCVPNNPTGNRDSTASLVEILEAASGTVIIDAAYAEFAGDQWSNWTERYPHLVILRTMSKAFSLASLRVGYAVGHPEQMRKLEACRPPGSISAISALIAEAALAAPERVEPTVAMITRERRRVADALGAMGVEVYPSVTNFLLCRFGPDAGRISETLMWEHAMVVRTFSKPPLHEHLRFTVRAPEENDLLLTALKGAIT